MSKNRHFYLLLLDRLMFEFRHLENDDLVFVKPVAYVFHDIPMLLLHDFSDEEGEKAWDSLLSRADHVQMTDVIASWAEETLASMVK
jgi:hypothetical protein